MLLQRAVAFLLLHLLSSFTCQ